MSILNDDESQQGSGFPNTPRKMKSYLNHSEYNSPLQPPKQIKSPLCRALLQSLDLESKTGHVPKQTEEAKIPGLADIKDLEHQIMRISQEKGWVLKA